jgi:hypothetical protein
MAAIKPHLDKDVIGLLFAYLFQAILSIGEKVCDIHELSAPVKVGAAPALA